MPAGRRPKLKADKEARGTLRPGRDPAVSPGVVEGVPLPPPWMDDLGKQYWAKVAKILSERHQLSMDDCFVLEALCLCYVEMRKAYDDMVENGRYQTVVTGSGDEMERIRPCVSVYQMADAKLKGYLIEFGLTAVSRAKVSMGEGGSAKPHGKGKKPGQTDGAHSGGDEEHPLDRYGLN